MNVYKILVSGILVLLMGSQLVGQSEAQVPVVDYDQLEDMLPQAEDQTVFVNFWATWCKPCVEEMPYINSFSEKYGEDDKVKVILVSLDFPSQLESRVIPFMKDKNLHPRVILLDDPDANSWIDKMHPSWSGAIPATVVYRGKEKKIYEKSFHSIQELEDILQSF